MKTSSSASLLCGLVLALGACQKQPDLEKMKHEWEHEVKELRAEAQELVNWQNALDKRRTELASGNGRALAAQAQGPLTATREELAKLVNEMDKHLGAEAEKARKSGSVLEMLKFTDETHHHITATFANARYQLDVADNLLVAAENAPVAVAAADPVTPPAAPGDEPPATPPVDGTPPSEGATPAGAPAPGTVPAAPPAPAH